MRTILPKGDRPKLIRSWGLCRGRLVPSNEKTRWPRRNAWATYLNPESDVVIRLWHFLFMQFLKDLVLRFLKCLNLYFTNLKGRLSCIPVYKSVNLLTSIQYTRMVCQSVLQLYPEWQVRLDARLPPKYSTAIFCYVSR